MGWKPVVFSAVLAGVGLLSSNHALAQQRNWDRPMHLDFRGTRGAVAGGTEFATDAGMRMYYAGGNAVDAGVAAMLAASVCEFSHFGLGGEAPILVRTREGKVFAIAGVGTMPKLATAEFFRNHKLGADEVIDPPEPNGLKDWVPVAGILPALVPGMVEAGLVALREFGTRSFADAVGPAIELADGFPIDEQRASSIQHSLKFINKWPASRKVFLANGRPPFVGEIFRQPELAHTLRSMVEAEKKAAAAGANREKAIDAVRDYFYRGEIAHKIDEFSKQNGGFLRYEDMAAFRLSPEAPVSTTFQSYTVYKPGFWSQGPTMIEALNILSGFDLPSMHLNSAEYIHTLVESLKLAYADRDTYYGDPKFVHIPEETLLSKEYGGERRKLITAQASLDFRPGQIGPHPPQHPSHLEIAHRKVDDALAAKDTTCIDAVDKNGVAFSATPSGAWMPSYIAGDTGIPLTQRAQSFLLVPGHPNELAGGKRPRVTLSPTLVTRPDGTVITLSTPGGDNQEQALIQVLFNAILFGYNAEYSVELPRFQTRHLVASFDNHAMSPGDLLLDERTPAAVVADLQKRNHKVDMRPPYDSGAAPAIIRLNPTGMIEAGSDPFYYRAARAW
ncbi:MAG: gamma-glutamyltransferase [Acidobacteriia bacterium]|nr:gamma-glutamyltransferase [Terriglobia bacterium]MBV8905315.1 gamma-glutamyltransferase [Terriglobia bacterium]